MNRLDNAAFAALFKEAFQKCFGFAMQDALSETESRQFYTRIFDETGLVIGAKSIKNYSLFIVNPIGAKEENPSVATLDTFARYVMNAPYTDETQRKEREAHYPYWFRYKEQFHQNQKKQKDKTPSFLQIAIVSIVAFTGLVIALYITMKPAKPGRFTEDFRDLRAETLVKNGWHLQSIDTIFWNRRSESKGQLSLYTLEGDNWPDSSTVPNIHNLLYRKIQDNCFTVEMRLKEFVPRQNWQQAGILIMEDTGFKGKSIRISIAYNDFFGGYTKPREILIQAITFQGNGDAKPVEIAHWPVYTLDSIENTVMMKNLDNSALRIEKNNSKFRLLYAGGPLENGPFKEITTAEFDMKSNYIGLFAIKGFVKESPVIPAHISYFSFTGQLCR